MMALIASHGDVGKLTFNSTSNVYYKQLVEQLKGLRIMVNVGPGAGRTQLKHIRDLQIRAGDYVFEKDGVECTVAVCFPSSV